MLQRCAAEVEEIGHGYDGEVIYGFVRLVGMVGQVASAVSTLRYHDATRDSLNIIKGQLAEIHASGRRVAIWGGTGKSAAFINRYGLDAARFPIVVDSDLDKVGTFVPGAGQEIRARSWLNAHPVEIVIIPPQWRARDVLNEIREHAIAFETILIEHQGRLIDYLVESNPYR
jgi:hypothetical protein